MRILTYKRTHTGDPDQTGVFGHNGCMGRVRSYRYDAVIGVGGTGYEPRTEGIAGKLTWIGVGPRRFPGRNDPRGEEVAFDTFVLLDSDGPVLATVAPHLARRIYEGRPRYVLDGYSEVEYAEAMSLIERAVRGDFGGVIPVARTRGCRTLRGPAGSTRYRPRRVICYPKG